MKVSMCSHRRVLNPCHLEMYNYQIDPYIGCEHHCYYCYGLNKAETDWDKEILIHENISEQMAREISSIKPQTIYFGMNTDPYQPSEITFKQTRKALELLAERNFSASILTKSGLVMRDIDLLTKMDSVGFSIAFLDDDVRRLFERRAPPNRERMDALKKIKEAGIETYTLICPVMPFITDVESLIDLVAPYSDTIWIYKLHMESKKDRNYLNLKSILSKHFPEMEEEYEKIALSRNHPYWIKIRKKLEEVRSTKHLNLRIEL
jgi:DNA repair photolyase